jgi:hypothetical protein
MKEINISKMDSADKVLSAIRACLSPFPVTAPIASLLADYQSQKQNRLIEDVLNRFFNKINTLEKRVQNLEYMNSEEFLYDLLQTMNYAQNEQNDYRRDMYAKYLVSCCHIDNTNNRFKRIFLEYMGKIDGLDFYIIKSLNTTFNCKNIIEDVEGSYNCKYKCNVTKKEVLNHVYYLTSLGLIEISDEEEVVKFLERYNEKPSGRTFKKSYMYQRTTLGDGLYQFIMKSEV